MLKFAFRALQNPYIITSHGYTFIRVYCLVTSTFPLRMYLHTHFEVLFTKQYVPRVKMVGYSYASGIAVIPSVDLRAQLYHIIHLLDGSCVGGWIWKRGAHRPLFVGVCACGSVCVWMCWLVGSSCNSNNRNRIQFLAHLMKNGILDKFLAVWENIEKTTAKSFVAARELFLQKHQPFTER